MFTDNVNWELWWDDNEINVVFMLANTSSILQLHGSSEELTFVTYWFKKYDFYVASCHKFGDWISMDSSKSKLETGKLITIRKSWY